MLDTKTVEIKITGSNILTWFISKLLESFWRLMKMEMVSVLKLFLNFMQLVNNNKPGSVLGRMRTRSSSETTSETR